MRAGRRDGPGKDLAGGVFRDQSNASHTYISSHAHKHVRCILNTLNNFKAVPGDPETFYRLFQVYSNNLGAQPHTLYTRMYTNTFFPVPCN